MDGNVPKMLGNFRGCEKGMRKWWRGVQSVGEQDLILHVCKD